MSCTASSSSIAHREDGPRFCTRLKRAKGSVVRRILYRERVKLAYLLNTALCKVSQLDADHRWTIVLFCKQQGSHLISG